MADNSLTTENSVLLDNSTLEEPIKDNLEAEMPDEAKPAEAEENKVATAYGKFKSAEALLEAYLNLEAEFTRRSQKLKELEESKASEAPSFKCDDSGELLSAVLSNQSVREAVVEDYLKSVQASRSVPLMVGGVPCSAPRNVPKSVKEAGTLAKQFLKN